MACAALALAQPHFGNPSPAAGGETSQKANAAADQAMYQKFDYPNAGRKGPAVIVLPGDIKSNNATFLQKFTANNIADFGEIEMSNANFQVLERSNLGPVLNEFALAYNLGDPEAARKYLRMGKLKSTKYVVKFDVLKTEQVAAAQRASTAAHSARWRASSVRTAARAAARQPVASPASAWVRCIRARRAACG